MHEGFYATFRELKSYGEMGGGGAGAANARFRAGRRLRPVGVQEVGRRFPRVGGGEGLKAVLKSGRHGEGSRFGGGVRGKRDRSGSQRQLHLRPSRVMAGLIRCPEQITRGDRRRESLPSRHPISTRGDSVRSQRAGQWVSFDRPLRSRVQCVRAAAAASHDDAKFFQIGSSGDAPVRLPIGRRDASPPHPTD